MEDQQWSVMPYMAASVNGPWLKAMHRGSETKVVIGQYPKWPGWVFEVPTRWNKQERTGTRALVRPEKLVCFPPAGARRNAAGPRPAERSWIQHLAVVWQNGGFNVQLALAAITLPYRPKSQDHQARCETIARLYPLARELGDAPRRPIAALYGVDLRTVDAWRDQARQAGVMPPHDPDRDVPAVSLPDLRERHGEHAGCHLNLHATRPVITHDGQQLYSLDIHLSGQWLDGTPAAERTLHQLAPTKAPKELARLARQLEEVDYPGATVKITADSSVLGV